MEYIFALFLFVFGTLFGSLSSVFISRIRNKMGGIVAGRSECPHCKHLLGPLELVPLFSYLFLRGKCRYCQARISPMYPLLELACGTLFALSGLFLVDYSLIITGNIPEILRLSLFLIVSFVTIVFVFYDILYMEIPDEVLLPTIFILFTLLISASFGLGDFLFSHFLTFENPLLNIPVANAVLGASAIFLFFLAQILVSDGRWMGGGDLRIALFMGLIAGFKVALLGLMLAYLYGSFIGIFIIAKTRKRDIQVPFGPYLALGLFTSLFFHEAILTWYFSIL